MKAWVVYYSRTGNTQKAAERLSTALGADEVEGFAASLKVH